VQIGAGHRSIAPSTVVWTLSARMNAAVNIDYGGGLVVDDDRAETSNNKDSTAAAHCVERALSRPPGHAHARRAASMSDRPLPSAR